MSHTSKTFARFTLLFFAVFLVLCIANSKVRASEATTNNQVEENNQIDQFTSTNSSSSEKPYKIAILVPYVGKIPRWLNYTIATASKSKLYEWFIFMDKRGERTLIIKKKKIFKIYFKKSSSKKISSRQTIFIGYQLTICL